MENTWCYSLDGERFDGTFETKEEAIEEAKRERENYCKMRVEETIVIYVGQPVVPSVSMDAEWNIERLSEQLYDQCGEYADTWEPSKEDVVLLQSKLDDVLKKWMEETRNEPGCYTVEDIEKVEIKI